METKGTNAFGINIDDFEFDRMWEKGAQRRRAKRDVEIFTERLPKELRKLEDVAKVFSKIKLNEKGLPW